MTINLFLPEDRKALRRERLRRLTMLFGVIGALVFGAGSVLLIPSFLFLRAQTESFSRALEAAERAPAIRRAAEIKDAISSFDRTLQAVAAQEASSAPIAPSVARVLEARANGVNVNVVSFLRGESEAERVTLRLDGRNRTRADLLAFVATLEALPGVIAVTSPVENLLLGRDARFSLTLSLQLQPLFTDTQP